MKPKRIQIKYILIILLFSVSLFLLTNLILSTFLIIIFGILTFLSVKISIKIDHISFDSFLSTSCFMGYTSGSLIGFIYAFLIGLLTFGSIRVSLLTISNVIIGSITAILTGILSNYGLGFSEAFIIAVVARTIIATPWYILIGITSFESMTQQGSMLIASLLLYLPLLSLIYPIIAYFL